MNNRQVPYVNFPAQYEAEKAEIAACVDGVFSKGEFVGGAEVELLEAELSTTFDGANVVAVNSGTDALMLAMEVLGIGAGDEVITPPNSFVASTAAIVRVGATPVFADVLEDQNIDPEKIKQAITPKTRAVMPVHLTGRMADMLAIRAIAEEAGLKIIEDAAQAIGAARDGLKSGLAGDVGCFSAHPLKNLNAAGDAGFMVTTDKAMADAVRLVRNHGLADRDTVTRWGTVSRMDTLQAAILRLRLKRLDGVIEKRRANAALYRQRINTDHVFIPPCRDGEFNTFHTFVIQADNRDGLQEFLAQKGIQSAIHYKVPIHLQPAAADLGYGAGDMAVTEAQTGRILSLPIHQFLSEDDIVYVSDAVNRFYDEGGAT